MIEGSASDALLTLAEVAVGLVGFTGIVLALTRGDTAVSASEALQLKELIRGGLAGVGLALLPVGAELAGAGGPALWRTVSAAHVVLVLVGPWFILTRQIRGLPAAERDAALYFCNFVVAPLVVLFQLGNALGWPFPPNAGVYFYGVCGTLVNTSVLFGRLLFKRLL